MRPARSRVQPWLAGSSGLLVALAAWLVYRLTLAPSISWAHHGADGGDLIAASYHLGVPHPPGYPLYVLIGCLFGRMEWLGGDVAFRFNLLSAVCAAGAAGLVTVVITRRSGALAGWLGGLTFAFGPILWSQATITEVYALNALLLGALLLSLFAGRPRCLLVGWLWGLAWTTHLTSVLFFPLIIWALGREPAGRRKGIVQLGVGWILGVLLYLALPLFAAGRPPINWGNPVTIEGWWWLISGKLYGGYVLGLPLADWPNRLVELVRFLVQQLTFPGALLALWGGLQLYDRDRPLWLAMLSSSGLLALYALAYNTADSHVLLIPLWATLAILLGFGVDELGRIWPKQRRLLWIALAIPTYLMFAGWQDADLSQDEEVAAFARSVWRQAPADAVIYTAADSHTFTLWYYRFVEGKRPDLTIVDQDLLSQDWYAAVLQVQDSRWIAGAAGRPVCVLSLEGELDCRD